MGSRFIFSEPVFLRNLVIYPLQGKDHNGFSPAVMDDLLRSNQVLFRELDTPEIDEIIFENQSEYPVLMLDGEEITGSLQNRIIAHSQIIEAKSSENIPVVCVEEERWDEIGGFKTGNCSYPQLRSILVKSRHINGDVQKNIWHEITRKLTVTRTQSATSSMHDIYDNLQEEILRYVEDFDSLNHNTIGFIGTAGNRILGCDLFQNSGLYQKFERKLIRSYALDAIEHQNVRGSTPDINKFFNSLHPAIKRSKPVRQKKHMIIKGRGYLGQLLMRQGKIVHLSAFPT
jgi:hypothetical protein